MASESEPSADLRKLYDGPYEALVQHETGHTPDAIREMTFESRRELLRRVGVNLPDEKPSTDSAPTRKTYHLG